MVRHGRFGNVKEGIHKNGLRGESVMTTTSGKHQIWSRLSAAVSEDSKRHIEEDGGRKPPASLSKQSVLLLVVHGLFATANALSGTFVNVYLWKVTENLATIGWFWLAHQIANAVTFFLAGKWVKEHDKMISLRLGVGLSAAFYLLVLMLERQAADYVVALGLLQGLAAGLFWLAFNVVYFEVTGPEDRDRFNGWAGLLGSTAGMLAPWVSGLIIVNMTKATGYQLIFTLSLGVFILGVVISFFLKKRKVPGNYEWFHAFRHLKERDNPWRWAVPALASQGVREGVFTFLIGLLVYISTNNEMQLGNYSLITSGVALVSFWLTGKLLRPKHRIRALLLGGVVMTLVILPFFWDVNYTTLLIFGIGTALFFPLFTIPMTSTIFDVIGRDQDSARHRVEYVVLRELGLNAGRILGTVGFIVLVSVSESQTSLNVLLLVIGSAPLAVWMCMKKLNEHLNKYS